METYSGTYIVEHREKYIGDKNPHYRSSWESRVIYYLDNVSRVKKWGYECVAVEYFNPIDQRVHKYFVDFYAEIVDKDQVLKKYLIEVKPFKQGPIIKHDNTFDFSNKPQPPKNRTKKAMNRFIGEAETYAINTYKWKSAIEYCKTNGWEFKVITENDIFILTRR